MKLAFLFSVSVFICMSMKAQKYYEVDLAKNSFDEPTISLKYTGIKLINKCPQKTYKTKIKVETELNGGQNQVSASTTWKDDSNLVNLVAAFNKLNNTADEAQVAANKANLENEFKKIQSNHANYADIKKDVEALISKTETTIDFTFDLEKNQNIYCQILKMNNDKEDKSWNLVLKTPRTVNYISHFGFTFSPNIIKEPSNYFSKQSGKSISGADSFTVAQLNSNGKDFWKDLSITANFLVPIKKGANTDITGVNFAWGFGIGISGDAKFSVFTGPSVLLNDFASFTLGFGVSNSYKLKGEYSPGQGLKENLNFDQLHTKGLRPNILLSLSFRLSKKQLQSGEIENVGIK